MTDENNDLVTPRPELEFPGLEPGDRWCVCLGRWVEAHEEGVAPPVVLEATAEAVLEDVYRRSRRLPRGLTPGLKPTPHNPYYD